MMRVPVCDPSREPKISDEAILALIQEHGYSQYDAQIILKFGGLNTSELRFGKTLLTADISGESRDIRLKNAYHRGKARHKKLLIFLDRQKNIAAFLSKYTQAEIFYAFNSGVLNGFSLPELINEIQCKEFYNLETARNEILYQYLLYEEGKIKMESRKDCEGTPQSAPDTVQGEESTEYIFRQYEAALAEYEKKHIRRSNDGLPKRIRTLMWSLNTVAAESANVPTQPGRPADITQAQKEDVPHLRRLFSHLPNLPDKKP